MKAHPTTIRHTTTEDVPTLVEFLRCMLVDMAAVGGHPVSTDREPWTNMEAEFRSHQGQPGYLHLLAETGGSEANPIGWAFARSKEIEPLFKPAQVLHLHALYVSPTYRRQGIGRALLEAVLEWGRSEGCTQAELSVLVDNPARALYDQLAFDAFEIEMTRKL